jgi:hypothetical protein
MSSPEPGIDRHQWASELEALDEALHDDPAGALPELADLVERMLTESGYDLADPVARAGEEREVVSEYLAARETSDLVERGSEGVGPGDVAAAIDGLRALAEYLLGVRNAS